MNEILALRVAAADNVATVFHDNVRPGTEITVVDHQGGKVRITAGAAIPYGHKMAVVPIESGAHIVKYGEVIGGATCHIAPGDHVHIHNLDSLRGRGDL